MIGVRRGARETWIDHDQRRVVLLLRLEYVLQRDRMCLGRVAADDQDRFGVVNIIVRIGHCTVAPGVGNTRDGGGVTDPGLVIDVVGAPDGGQLAEQVGLLVVVLGGTEPVDRIRTGAFSDLQQLVAHLVDRLIPGDARPLAVDQFGRILQAPFAVPVFAHRCTFGAVRTAAEGVIECRLLTGPDTVVHFCDNAAADRTVGTDGSDLLSRARLAGRGIGTAHHGRVQTQSQRGAAGHQTG